MASSATSPTVHQAYAPLKPPSLPYGALCKLLLMLPAAHSPHHRATQQPAQSRDIIRVHHALFDLGGFRDLARCAVFQVHRVLRGAVIYGQRPVIALVRSTDALSCRGVAAVPLGKRPSALAALRIAAHLMDSTLPTPAMNLMALSAALAPLFPTQRLIPEVSLRTTYFPSSSVSGVSFLLSSRMRFTSALPRIDSCSRIAPSLQ